MSNNVIKLNGGPANKSESGVSIEFSGSRGDLVKVLEKSDLSDKLKDLFSVAGYVGNFRVRAQKNILGTPATKGKFKLISPGDTFILASYHPEKEGNDGNVKFAISVPVGLNSNVFFTNLKHSLAQLENRNDKIGVVEDDGKTELNSETFSIFEDQEALAIVVDSLKNQATKINSEFLTQTTAVGVVVAEIGCNESVALKVLEDLCEGEIIQKRGKGKSVTFVVGRNNIQTVTMTAVEIEKPKEESKSGIDAMTVLTNITQTMEKAKQMQESLPKMEARLKELIEIQNKIPAALKMHREEIEGLEIKISDLKKQLEKINIDIKKAETEIVGRHEKIQNVQQRETAQSEEIEKLSRAINDAKAFLGKPETQQALALAQMIGSFTQNK